MSQFRYYKRCEIVDEISEVREGGRLKEQDGKRIVSFSSSDGDNWVTTETISKGNPEIKKGNSLGIGLEEHFKDNGFTTEPTSKHLKREKEQENSRKVEVPLDGPDFGYPNFQTSFRTFNAQFVLFVSLFRRVLSSTFKND